MIPKGLFAQIGMVVISIAIIITYVQPAFSAIGKVQDNISVYRGEREKVAQVNSQLNALIETQKSVSLVDQNRLLTYMPDPDNVDPIAIPRDLALIAVQAGVIYKEASFDGFNPAPPPGQNPKISQEPQSYQFSFSVEGTYSQLKNLFRLLEQNNYPLEVHDLTVEKIDGGFLSATMQLTTYAYTNPLPSQELVF